MYVSILHLRSHLQTKPFNKELDFSFFQITNGHHSVEGYRGGRHGFQTTECSSLSTWVRNPSHLVNLFTSDRPPYCLLLSLLWVPGWGFKRGSSPLWLPRSHRWSKSNFVQIQRRGDSCQHFQLKAIFLYSYCLVCIFFHASVIFYCFRKTSK